MFGHDNQKDDHQSDDQTTQDNNQVPQPDEHLDAEAHSDDAAVITPNDSQPSQPDDYSASNGDDASSDVVDNSDTPVSGDSDDLIAVKQQALRDLGPLVDHLDQTPEEKFKTTMMMIQAADNKDLIQTAYDAAKQISDDKARAQALLDVINEINYFTHPQSA